ncbi:MAG: nucleotidyltransferase family protein [Dehalococcoidia bacterium]
MATSALDVTPEEMAEYRAAYRRRLAEAEERRARLELRARALASEAAGVLRERFGATRVLLYGSLARGQFLVGSDIDLVAWGIDSDRWLDVVGVGMELGREVEMSVALAQMMRPGVLTEALQDGVDL